MFSHFYQNYIIEKPKTIFLLLIFLLLSFGYFSKDFRLDASSDTLLLENDPDLEFLRKINDTYGAKEFLVLTYSPKEKITSELKNWAEKDKTNTFVKNLNKLLLQIFIITNFDESICIDFEFSINF